jgi:hypothetical protein
LRIVNKGEKVIIEDDNSPEALARDAASWRQLRAKVAHCLEHSPTGWGSIWGGDDNLHASVEYQSRGKSGMVLTLRWTAEHEVREDFNYAVKPEREHPQD